MYRKYNSKKVVINGIKFDSKIEAKRYEELKLLVKYGKIKELELQKKFVLIPTIRTSVETLRETSYYCDFYYFDVERNEYIVEDVKGMILPEYQLKKKMFINLYSITFFENGKYKKYYKKIG